MIKVGDRVRIKNFVKRPLHWNSSGKMDKWMGKTMTVIAVENEADNRFFMDEDKCEGPIGGWAWRESDFEKVEEETMTKSDLKDGMICIQRDGTKFMWLNGELRGMDRWCSGTKEDLTGSVWNNDIIAVYDPVGNTIVEMLKHDYSAKTPIWERVEPKKMTIAEIEEALGYPVEVVK